MVAEVKVFRPPIIVLAIFLGSPFFVIGALVGFVFQASRLGWGATTEVIDWIFDL